VEPTLTLYLDVRGRDGREKMGTQPFFFPTPNLAAKVKNSYQQLSKKIIQLLPIKIGKQ
jgi:hypothetical protein